MICPNCGSNNPDGTAFCANCGSPVSNGAPNNGAIPPQAQPNFQGSAPNGGIVILLGIITCGIYMWYWLYKQGDNLDQIKASRGLPAGNSGILYLILAIVGLGIISYALMQNELNQLA